MQIDFFGHACLRTRHDTTSLLMDPWFSREGAFFRSWFQFPENTHLLDAALEGVTDLAVSHNHADHFDPEVLRRAMESSADRKLHIARFATSWFKELVDRELASYRDRIEVHPPGRPFSIGEVDAWFVPEESPGQIDSAIVVRDADGGALVNLNDARLSSDQLTAIRGSCARVSVLALQASGASEYPINYTWDEAEIRKRALEKRRLKLEACERIIDALEPVRVLFFAGPPAFLFPELASFAERRDDSVFPDQLDVLRHYEEHRPDVAARAYFALPGEDLADAPLWPLARADAQRLAPFTDKPRVLEAYRASRADLLEWRDGPLPAPDRVLAHLERLAVLSPWAADRIGGAVCVVVRGENGEESYVVDFLARRAWRGSIDDPLYVLTIPAIQLEAVLTGRVTWDDAFLSLRMTFDERTDRFVPHLKTLLKYMDAEMFPALQAYEAGLSTPDDVPMFEVEIGGETRRVQRLCPHAGVDLAQHGLVDQEARTITCMAHRFCFELDSGACLNAQGFSLRVEEPPAAT